MSFPPAEEARRLHERLLGDDPVAPSDFCAAFLKPLLGHLRARLGDVDPHLLETAVHQTLVDHVKNPHRYDPVRNPDLGGYLRMAARGDARNLLRTETRRAQRHEVVELDSLPGNTDGEDGPALRLIRGEEEARRDRLLAAVERQCDEADCRVLRLVAAGVKEHTAFAVALGIVALPIEEQRDLVKQAKDRVMKRLRRLANHA